MEYSLKRDLSLKRHELAISAIELEEMIGQYNNYKIGLLKYKIDGRYDCLRNEQKIIILEAKMEIRRIDIEELENKLSELKSTQDKKCPAMNQDT